MIQLTPGEHFTIQHGLTDHTDSGTYYVRSVIKKLPGLTTLATVDLTDNGNRLFTGDWVVAPDIQGTGFYISIVTTVYTDSGYTTKSQNYAERFDEYLVQARNPHFGGMGGADIDYKRLQKMIDEAVAKATPVPVDLSNLEARLDALDGRVGGIYIPSPEKLDLEPVKKQVEGVLKAVKSLPEPEKIDLQPLIRAIDNYAERNLKENKERLKEYVMQLTEAEDKIRDEYMRELELVRKDIGKIQRFMNFVGSFFSGIGKMAPEPEEESEPTPTKLSKFLKYQTK